MELIELLKKNFANPHYEDYLTIEDNRVIIKQQEVEDFSSPEECKEIYINPVKATIWSFGLRTSVEERDGLYIISWGEERLEQDTLSILADGSREWTYYKKKFGRKD